jgi:CheY-like chemotaxis protein
MNSDFTILLAEDSETDVLLVRRALQGAGIHARMEVVADGEEAIAYLRGENQYTDRQRYPMPNLLLLDIKMPGKNGLEVLEWLRSTEQPGLNRLPVIIMSASNFQSDIDRAYDLGVNAYLMKPSAFGELVGTMRRTAEFWKDTAEHPSV